MSSTELPKLVNQYQHHNESCVVPFIEKQCITFYHKLVFIVIEFNFNIKIQ
jgi:hypothetical protein